MSNLDLWSRAVDEMREDEDPRWHAVADWLRTEVIVRAEMEPFTDLLNAAFELESGIKGYIKYVRGPDGNPSMHLDTSEGATAVALAYLGEEPKGDDSGDEALVFEE